MRRLRLNLLIGGVPARAEQDSPGHALVIGEAVIGIHSFRGRCIVTSIDPGTGAQDLDVFRGIRHRFGGRPGLDSWVMEPGTIWVGAQVILEHIQVQPRPHRRLDRRRTVHQLTCRSPWHRPAGQLRRPRSRARAVV
ncbi:MOSC domain-containing protein [Kribbella sp. NPDC050124]|uniref:MOSC domain-containing protein n=1 Tax=Kribbella sp. NPDC050124 TaxID=3364114 RepID=UPI0037A47209